MEWLIYLLVYLVGVVVGCYVTMRTLPITAGTLKIDKSNSEKDIYRLEIKDLEKLSKKHRIVLEVDAKADLSQK